MSTTKKKKSDQLAAKHMAAFKKAYKEKWAVPVGKRKCQYSTADDCLGIADEDQFDHHKCNRCVRLMHRELYAKRMLKQGKELVGRGRPLGAKDLKPRKNARKDE